MRIPPWNQTGYPGHREPLPRDGTRDCGVLERVIRRHWSGAPRRELVAAVDELAGLPVHLATRLAEDLDGIWLGADTLAEQPEPDGSCDARVADSAGLYMGRTVVIAGGAHSSGALVHHMIGHALCDLDETDRTPEWRRIMRFCRPLLGLDRYRDHPSEWWAETYALCASRRLDRLVRLLAGDGGAAAAVAAYHQRRQGWVR
ncbi:MULTISPECIES: hypothetical protein [Streptosporangium]|uniref:Uncharacterized protein n=1 Tax=Streptosporangium brasiliense TaxID=47480 RepID=A0ABT9RD41_9ACTN|nr:hypothetical protein [Streptosporangium brasiliense]MDP9866689.1 hypothetical protein [Streptosporangium brasiliense]